MDIFEPGNRDDPEITAAEPKSSVAFAALILAVIVSFVGALIIGLVTGSVLWAVIGYGVICVVVFLGVILLALLGERSWTAPVRRYSSEDTPGSSGEPAETWHQMKRAPKTEPKGRCLILASALAPGSSDITTPLSEGGYDIDLCNDAEAVLSSLLLGPKRNAWSLFVVDLDFLQGRGELEDCVDELMRLRSERPDLPLILVSCSFARDDYDEDRLSIADASLRAPVLGTRVLYAARIAIANNQAWQARCADRSET